MKLPQIFQKAANRIAHNVLRARGFEITQDAKGKAEICLLDSGKHHKVYASGKVRTTPRILAHLKLDEIIEATKDFASPKIKMMVRMMERQFMQQQLQPIPVRVENRQQPQRRTRTDI